MKMEERTLLSGNIGRQLIGLAIPLLLGNMLQQFYNTADSLIVGRFLGTDAFASVGISGSIMNLFIFILNGFCVGLSVIFAQFYGMGDKRRFREEVFVAVSFGMVFTICVSLFSICFLGWILKLIHTPQELMAYAMPYLMIIFAGLPFTYFYNLFSGILRAVGNTKAALYFLAIAIVGNVVLDILFIGGLGTGTGGAAAATILSQCLSAVCCYFYLKRYYADLLCRRENVGMHKELLAQTLKFGFASALHESSLYIGKICVQGAVNTLGTSGIAAYTATMRIEGLANSFGDSGGSAMSVLISQNMGAGKKERVRESLKKGFCLNITLCVILSLLMFFGANTGVRFFINDGAETAVKAGADYMRVIAVFYLFCFLGCIFVGYFRGTGRVQIPFFVTTIHISVRVILSYLLVGRIGLSAVAFATGIGWILAVTIHTCFYLCTRIKEKGD